MYSALSLGLIPVIVGSVAIMAGGGQFFRFLLNGAASISDHARWAMIAMLAFILVQSAAGSLLVGAGRYRDISRAAAITASLMAIWCAVTYAGKLPFDVFLAGYVALYGVHALMFQWLFNRVNSPIVRR
jgi:hypothetical protein